MNLHRFLSIFFVVYSIMTRLPTVLSTEKENRLKVIVDVIETFNKPSHIVAKLCWGTIMKNKLMKGLSSSNNPRSIKFVNNIYNKDLVRTEHIIFMVDVSCNGASEFLIKAASRKYFGRPNRWILINRVDSKSEIPSEIDNMDILVDSEVYVVHCKFKNWTIDLAYKIKPNRAWKIENYGNWTIDGGLVVSRLTSEVPTAMRRRNLNKESIITSTVISDNSTLADLELLRYKEIDPVTKSGYHTLTPLYEFINASRELIFTDAWGYNVNGTWTGMLGHLYQEKAELGGLVMFITKERMQLVEYLSHPTASSVKFIFREPPLSYQNNLYLLPFTGTVWCCIGGFVLILIIFMYVNAYWELRKNAEDEEADLNSSVLTPSMSDVTVFVMSAISQQGSNVELKGMLGRFVILVIFLVFLFLYTAYSASIVVLLQSSSNQIRTLSDLLNSKLELGVEDTPYNRYWFENEKEPIRRAIYEKKIAPSGSKPKYFDLVDGILQLQKKPFAFNCNLGTSYKVIEKYFYEHEKCGLQEIAYIQDDNPWQACRKGSPYKEIFKLGLLRNAEHGLNDRSNRLMFSKKPVCSVHGGSFVSVSLVDCYPILLLLIYGMILGVVLLLAEIFYHRQPINKNTLLSRREKYSAGQ